jgi:hypothetical protein
MLTDNNMLLPVPPDDGRQLLIASTLEKQLRSLLAAHQDTGVDIYLKAAQDICRQLIPHPFPGPYPPREDPDTRTNHPSERILYGDIQHASFLRDEGLDTLREAISCYEGVTVSDRVLSRRLALGHGSALVTMYDQVTGLEHAEKARQLLNSVIAGDAHDELAAQALCYLTPLMFDVMWDGEGPSAIVDDYLSRIDEALTKPWRPYLRIKLLLTRALVAARLSFIKSDLGVADDCDKFGCAALDACPPDHFLLADAYHRLASMYDWRNQVVGDAQDLEQAMLLASRGLETRSSTPSLRCTLLNLKARCLGRQSRVTGDLNLLENAIALSREALALCPSRHRKYRVHVTGLMFLLGTHFDSTGRIEFLDEIISFADLDLVVKSQWVACNIAEALRDRAQLASSGTAFTLLQRAIHILEARSKPSPNLFTHEKAAIYRELGTVCDLQVQLGIEVDQGYRLQLARDAAALAQTSFEGRTEAMISLVSALLGRAVHNFSDSLVDEAEDIIHAALKDDQVLDHLRASLKALQAELQIVRASMHDAPVDLSAAWHAFETIVSDASARPRDRLRIAIRWATLAEGIDAKSALLAYQHAVDVLPQVGYIGEDLMGRVQALRQARDLAPRAASFALGIGDVEQAIQLLEHSRGVLWQQSLHLRPPLHLLPPHLASQLADVSKTLDSNDTNATERRKSAERFQSIIQEIRSEPGYENFLLPRTYDQLVRQLPEGFFVWLIPSKAHCDVVIVDSRANPQTIHFRHAGLNLDRLQAIATAFGTVHVSALRSIDRKTRPAPLPKNGGTSQSHELLLEELWTSLVQKVIRTLDMPVSVFHFREIFSCLMIR